MTTGVSAEREPPRVPVTGVAGDLDKLSFFDA
jgi:hypothetical protein